jgi:hypothetical protein
MARKTYRGVIAIPAYLIVGIGVGLASATQLIDGNIGQFAVNNGPWRTWPSAGTPLSDPYTRGHYLAYGRLPMSAFEAVEFLATTDSANDSLEASCNYVIKGPIIAARWWRITAQQEIAPELLSGTSILSQSAIVDPDNEIRIIASKDPQPGNWLKLQPQSSLAFTLTLFSPADSVKGAHLSAVMPAIERGKCL